MRYYNIKEAVFLRRINRFVAEIKLKDEIFLCHVKNTGRCKELLISGCRIFVEENDNENRKTKYSLISVIKNGILINMDSQAPNKVVSEWLKKGGLYADYEEIKAEKVYHNSRFDFYMKTKDKNIFIEVKGVTLEEKGVVRFPDAPTKRGRKHLEELSSAVKEGYECYVLFVVQMKGVKFFEPNCENGDDFYIALKNAKNAGVKILAYDCIVQRDSLEIDERVEVKIQA